MKKIIRQIIFWAIGADVTQTLLDNKHLREKCEELKRLLDSESLARQKEIETLEETISDLKQYIKSSIEEVENNIEQLMTDHDDLRHEFDRHDHGSIDEQIEELEGSVLNGFQAINKTLSSHQEWMREMTNKELSRVK